MKVFHLPIGITTVNDVFRLDVPASILMSYARKNKTFRESRDAVMSDSRNACALCNNWATEAHHIKPLWACAIDTIMLAAPSSTWDAFEFAGQVRCRGRQVEFESTFAEWHSPSNLTPLCGSCHLSQQAKDDLWWKRELGLKHRLVYTIAWADLLAKAQYSLRPKCPLTLPEYIEWYMEKHYKVQP